MYLNLRLLNYHLTDIWNLTLISFNACNYRKWFIWLFSRLFLYFRVLESLLVAMVTTVVIFAASMLLGECRDLSPSSTHNTTVSVRFAVGVSNSSNITHHITLSLKLNLSPECTYLQFPIISLSPNQVSGFSDLLWLRTFVLTHYWCKHNSQ